MRLATLTASLAVMIALVPIHLTDLDVDSLAGQAFWAALALTRDAVFGGNARNITSTANGASSPGTTWLSAAGAARSDGVKLSAVTAGRQ